VTDDPNLQRPADDKPLATIVVASEAASPSPQAPPAASARSTPPDLSTNATLDLSSTEPLPGTQTLVAAKNEDLTTKDQLPSAAKVDVEQLPFEAQREWIRGALALSLVSALIVTLLLFLLGDMFDHPIDSAKLNSCVTALVGLVGSVTGFYFGSQSVKK
jgi:hypothetical protein